MSSGQEMFHPHDLPSHLSPADASQSPRLSLRERQPLISKTGTARPTLRMCHGARGRNETPRGGCAPAQCPGVTGCTCRHVCVWGPPNHTQGRVVLLARLPDLPSNPLSVLSWPAGASPPSSPAVEKGPSPERKRSGQRTAGRGPGRPHSPVPCQRCVLRQLT